jgi:hypothetical protein
VGSLPFVVVVVADSSWSWTCWSWWPRDVKNATLSVQDEVRRHCLIAWQSDEVVKRRDWLAECQSHCTFCCWSKSLLGEQAKGDDEENDEDVEWVPEVLESSECFRKGGMLLLRFNGGGGRAIYTCWGRWERSEFIDRPCLFMESPATVVMGRLGFDDLAVPWVPSDTEVSIKGLCIGIKDWVWIRERERKKERNKKRRRDK